MRTRKLAVLLLSAPIALALATSARHAAPQEELSRKEQETLVREYMALSDRTSEGRTEQARILKALESVAWPDSSGMRRWNKALDKNRSKLPKLEKKSGMHYYWEKEKRGKYYVGGDTKKPKGLFIGLHGGGVGAGEAVSSKTTYSKEISELDWVGIFPEVLEKTEHGWTTSGTEEWVMTLVDEALRTWDIDPQNVFLGGHSMGGFGSWVLGAHHADRFAALMPSAGAPTPVTGPSGKYEFVMYGVIPNLFNMPMIVFQSIDDVQVPPEANQNAVRCLNEARERWGRYENFEYWETNGRGHQMPEGGVSMLLDKIVDYERTPHPEQLVWQPTLDWKRQFYWLHWENPPAHPVVVAKLDREHNAIDIQLSGASPKGLSVLLSDAIVDMDREVTVRLEDEVVFQGVPERSFAVWIMTGAAGDPGRTYEAMIPVGK